MDSNKKSADASSIMNITLMATCFLAGIYVGRKLSNTVRRVSSLISVGPSKLALVVRSDLKMGRGKIASQCCHGTIAAYLKMQENNPKLLQAWLDSGQPKVVLKAADLNQLHELSKIWQENLHWMIIGNILMNFRVGLSRFMFSCMEFILQFFFFFYFQVACISFLHSFRMQAETQIAQGSETVLAVGPGTVKDVDKVTGKLQLL
ncbi:peptidyl-tRNA hydrolase 2, mitochondrial-like [Macrobrachium nipponense]|uniref:peptidyl-tRNA hydrolase 2, mitochondrial-like n=1 Tax=Macrobrachium nipponense TaxID=159736 RepID=UPI0030C84C76